MQGMSGDRKRVKDGSAESEGRHYIGDSSDAPRDRVVSGLLALGLRCDF
jgi:hypothetical protein